MKHLSCFALLLLLPLGARAQAEIATSPLPPAPGPAADSLWVQADTYSRHLGRLLHFSAREHDRARLLTYLELRDLRQRRATAGHRPRAIARRVGFYYSRLVALLPYRTERRYWLRRHVAWPVPGTEGCPSWARLPVPEMQ